MHPGADSQIEWRPKMMPRIAFPLLALMVAGGCSGSDATDPMSHDKHPRVLLAVASPLSESFPRSGDLRATKECTEFTGLAGSFCTITSSTLKEIEVGSRVVYLQPASNKTPAGSDVILYTPGPGNNTAFGHCSTYLGLCTFSGGTGKFTWFDARVVVTSLGKPNWAWNGTYSFSPHD
jgi:hypothetical protein